MISKSLREMIKGRWREFRREPSAMFFVVFMPILWMIILGLAFSDSETMNYSIGINSETNTIDYPLKNLLVEEPHIKVHETSPTELNKKLIRGEILLIMEQSEEGEIVYTFDPSNPSGKQTHFYIHHLVQEFYGRIDPKETLINSVKAVGSRYIDFLIPGLLALSLFTTSLFGTGMTIVANRRENLLKRYMATPMSSYEYIVSHIVGRYFIFVVEVVCIMLCAKLLFDFKVQGTWTDVILVGLLSTATFTAIAILCGSKTSNTSTYNGINNLITIPMMMVSGIWFSRANFPDWLSHIVDFLPLTACVDALRKVTLEGQSLSHLTFEVALLAGYALICTVAAKINFRWYE